MSNIKEFETIPEISFIDGITAEQVRDNLISEYKRQVEEAGGTPDIHDGSPERLMLYAMAAQLYQAYAYIDNAAKMGILKYSKGDYLDNLGLLRGLTRRPATASSCTVKFKLSDIRGSYTAIPAGTRIAASNIYFTTAEYLEIPAGSQSGEVKAVAYEPGTLTNGLLIGAINTIVDSIAYVESVENTTETTGGTDIETDDAFTLRIYQSPAGYSVAGPMDAYIFHARQAIADIGDVIAYTPEPGAVDVVFMMSDGSIPNADKLKELEEALSADDIRPLTDTVTTKAPEEVSYNIQLNYYIARSDQNRASTIQQQVTEAIKAYKQWQRHIGRDISASMLVHYIMAAGAKRVEVIEPTFTPLERSQVAKCAEEAVTYGGLESD